MLILIAAGVGMGASPVAAAVRVGATFKVRSRSSNFAVASRTASFPVRSASSSFAVQSSREVQP